MVFTDEALIRRCLDGDTDAFGFLVDKYKGAVYALAYHKIGNHHDAEDMAQETFLKAYQRLSTLRNTSGFAGWLYVICANRCYSWLRKRRKERETVVPLRQLSHAEVSDSSYAKYAGEQIEESVREAIDALPESERTVITLHYLGGLSCQEISRFLGVSLSAAKMRLFRARSQLKERMIEMLEQTWGRSQLGSGFTFHLMETVQRMSPFSVPRPDFRRWIPIGALMATLILRFGSLFVSSTIPPFSLDDVQENMEVTILDLPQQEDNPQVNLPIVMTANIQIGDGGDDPGKESQTRMDVSAIPLSDGMANEREPAETLSIKGVVLQDDRIRAGAPVYALVDGNLQAKTVSRSDGTYQFDNLPVPSDGRYYSLLAYIDGEVVGWAKPAEPVSPDSLFVLIQLSPTRRMVGRVEDQEGKPVEGASVQIETMYRRVLLGRLDSPQLLSVPSFFPSANTDATGHFALHNVPEDGLARIRVEKDGYGIFTAYRQPDDMSVSWTSADAVQLDNQLYVKPVEYRIALMPAVVIEGHVIDNISGQPVEGVLLQCKGSDVDYSGLDMTFLMEALTGKDGSYRFDRLPADSGYTISLAERLPEHTGAMIRDISIGPGETIRDMDIELIKGGVISGRIATRDGKPMPDVVMDFKDDSGEHSVKTDAEGEYHFRAMTGEVTIPYKWGNCIPAEGHPGPQIVVREGKDAGSVDYIYVGVRICGSVVTADGRPVAGATINEWTPQWHRRVAESREDGTFVLRIDFPEGSELNLAAEKPSEGLSGMTTITVAPDVSVKIVLGPPRYPGGR